MGPIRWFLFVYVLGGLTFVPLVIVLVLAFGYYTLPLAAEKTAAQNDDPARLSRSNDEKVILRTGTDDLAEKFQRKHDTDVAAGYFAVCREYVPGGVNGKPPDKLSPAGEVVATESPSVYQSMYRSIFDRSQKPTIEPHKDGAGRTMKRANNVFYVVLRHGHLMLYDDVQQLDVRYVISLDYHDVDIYGGVDKLQEGELWIKRNAIRLKRKPRQPGDKVTSLPFFLFSENLSEKEDFYFALLKNQEKSSDDVPVPQEFEVKHIVTLVQKLHSSEEHLQTRWLNAVIGRLFLAMYKTPELEQFIRQKLTKKISRVKKPHFITRLALQKIVTGDGGPFVTNPRLKDLTVNGDCTVEFDVLYTGNFRVEIGATARLELGSRFKAREVDMVLAATCKRLEGHVLARFKPPPSNRLWFTFEKMPMIDMVLEPIVSTRQITYNIILKAIESRIREVVAETIVLPFWDDIPFLDTAGQRYRGGVWKREVSVTPNTEIKDEDPEDEAIAGGSGSRTPELQKMKDDRNMSMPVLTDTKKISPDKKSISSMNEILGTGGDRTPPIQAPRVIRSTSFASMANPMVTADHADMDSPNKDSDNQKRDTAAAILQNLSARSTGASPSGSQAGSPEVDSSLVAAMKGRSDSTASKGSTDSAKTGDHHSLAETATTLSTIQSPSSITPATSTTNSRPASVNEDTKATKTLSQQAKAITSGDRKQLNASINAATAAAQKWGWGVLARNRQKDGQGAENMSDAQSTTSGAPSMPMGRGRPLPPPGIPLPPPEKTSAIPNPFSLPKRKAIPPPLLPKRQEVNINGEPSPNANLTPSPLPAKTSPRPPNLPERRNRKSSLINPENEEDEVLVVEAPAESAPNSPEIARSEHHDDFFGHGEESVAVPSPTPSPQPPPRTHTPTQVATPTMTTTTTTLSPTRSNDGKRKVPPPPLPMRRTESNDSEPNELMLTFSSEAGEVANRERSMSMMEAASIGSGYNE